MTRMTSVPPLPAAIGGMPGPRRRRWPVVAVGCLLLAGFILPTFEWGRSSGIRVHLLALRVVVIPDAPIRYIATAFSPLVLGLALVVIGLTMRGTARAIALLVIGAVAMVLFPGMGRVSSVLGYTTSDAYVSRVMHVGALAGPGWAMLMIASSLRRRYPTYGGCVHLGMAGAVMLALSPFLPFDLSGLRAQYLPVFRPAWDILPVENLAPEFFYEHFRYWSGGVDWPMSVPFGLLQLGAMALLVVAAATWLTNGLHRDAHRAVRLARRAFVLALVGAVLVVLDRVGGVALQQLLDGRTFLSGLRNAACSVVMSLKVLCWMGGMMLIVIVGVYELFATFAARQEAPSPPLVLTPAPVR